MAGAAGLGGLAALALLLPMEAGVPIPLPADLVMFSVGERVAAGTFPLWLAGRHRRRSLNSLPGRSWRLAGSIYGSSCHDPGRSERSS